MSSHKRRYGRMTHGGHKGRGKRKLERPLDSKKWIHLVLKSDKAKGPLSFLSPRNRINVEGILQEKARKFGVRIGELVNVGTHFHLKIKIPSREAFQKFLRAVTTLIARRVTGARRGQKFGRFWQGLAFTRVITSRLELTQLSGYLEANRLQARGSQNDREVFLEAFNRWVYRLRWRDGPTNI